MALPPVILLHAFPVDARLWEDVEQQLREQGIEPIVPNLRGFGTNRDELPTEPNLDALADDVAALIEGQAHSQRLSRASLWVATWR